MKWTVSSPLTAAASEYDDRLAVRVRSIVVSVYVCLCVGLSVHSHISRTTRHVQFHLIFFTCDKCGRGFVLFGRQCDILCTSGFEGDVMFSYDAENSLGHNRRRRVCFDQFARWRYQSDARQRCLIEIPGWQQWGRSLLSLTASC